MTTSAFAGPGRHSVYTGRATNWPMVVLNAALVAPLLAAVSATTAGNRGALVNGPSPSSGRTCGRSSTSTCATATAAC